MAVMIGQEAVRTGEAHLGAAIAAVLTGTETTAVGATQAFYWSSGTPEMFGLRVTAECTAAFIAGPFLLLAGAVVLGRRMQVSRVLTGTVLALGIVLLETASRLGLIAWTTFRFGIEDGYRWSHTVGGSLVSILGIIVALVVFLRVVTRGRAAVPS